MCDIIETANVYGRAKSMVNGTLRRVIKETIECEWAGDTRGERTEPRSREEIIIITLIGKRRREKEGRENNAEFSQCNKERENSLGNNS